ncbi:MAG TPA: hypothetical protein VMH81_00135 [Bryobacteraceae bacterium]|nr:hypothetical protein [Bryobacteraceae bacterium]
MSEQTRQKRLPCRRCGGTHFQKAAFRQYVGGTYSASPGGELYEDGPPWQILVCLCGEPLVPHVGRSLTLEQRKSLEESLNKAFHFRRQTELDTIRLRLLEEFPSRKELEKLHESVDTLMNVLQNLEKDPCK